MTPGEELAREAARLERARFNHPLPRPEEHPDTDEERAARRAAMLREFNHLKAVS